VQLRTGAATSAGGREQNEDNYLATATLIGVADGVGGRPAGGLASRIAIDMLRGAPDSLSLSQFVPAISAVIRARSAGDPDTENMATTLDAVQLVPDDGGYRMSGVHIGDGLALVDDGIQIRQLTTPHTLGAELARQGNPASAHHPERAGLLQAIGLHDKTEADMWSQPALIGSRFILTTDGLIDALGLKKLFRYLEQMRGDDPEQVAEALIDRALQHPAGSTAALDNLTVVVADIVEQSTEEQPGQPERPVPAALPSEIHRAVPPPSGLTGAAQPEEKSEIRMNREGGAFQWLG
jgi:serine/threonine protein phosphatase PrpC